MSTATATAPRNLFQKLAAISGELGAIAKDGKAPDVMGGFAFISHGAVTGHLRQKLAERQVAILPTLELVTDEAITIITSKGERSARRVVVRLTLEFVNGENPEERHQVVWFGEGIDTADKGLQKAATSAQKYALMKAFLVSDKDDPDGADPGADTGGSGIASASSAAAGEVPSGAQLAELYRLAESLPRPAGRDYVDQQLGKYTVAAIRRALFAAHEKQCGMESCEHVTEQTALPAGATS